MVVKENMQMKIINTLINRNQIEKGILFVVGNGGNMMEA